MTVAIADIKFGNIDARHEILSRDPANRRLFLDAFFVPDNFELDSLLKGDKFVIVGQKGSGKTAYLRFIQHKLNEKEHSDSRFIIFRDEITQQDRDKISTLASFRFYEEASLGTKDEYISDCTSAWQLFIHREIATLLARNHGVCAMTPDVTNYVALLDRFFSSFKTSKFKQFLQRIAKGRVKLAGLGNSLEVEADFTDSHGNIDVSEFVRFCNGVVAGLDFDAEREGARLNIFFDELNISFVSGQDFKKNAVLIRDLVAACGISNSLFAENQLPIYVYTAIRSEVVDSIESSVRELRKWIDDKAVVLSWMLPSVDYKDQPIIKLLERRILANELSIEPNRHKEISLSTYFSDPIFGRPFSDYIIFESWARPRDLVRLLGSAAKYVPKGEKFNSDAFHKARSEYSKGSWEEKRDELNSKYAQAEIDSIKRTLTGFQTTFTLLQLETRIAHLSGRDPRIKQFFSGRILEVVLEDLFKVGVLGNLLKSKKGSSFPSFQYSGLTNFSPEGTMCIHKSLWRELDLESISGPMAHSLRRTKRS